MTMKFWDLAIFSEGSIDSELGDKYTYPNLVRISAPYDKLGPAALKLMRVSFSDGTNYPDARRVELFYFGWILYPRNGDILGIKSIVVPLNKSRF